MLVLEKWGGYFGACRHSCVKDQGVRRYSPSKGNGGSRRVLVTVNSRRMECEMKATAGICKHPQITKSHGVVDATWYGVASADSTSRNVGLNGHR